MTIAGRGSIRLLTGCGCTYLPHAVLKGSGQDLWIGVQPPAAAAASAVLKGSIVGYQHSVSLSKVLAGICAGLTPFPDAHGIMADHRVHLAKLRWLYGFTCHRQYPQSEASSA